MATIPSHAIAERADIHKACRSLESVVNLLNDYSEAARAIVTLHKKLAKSMRDVAAVKPTGEIPGNTFGASANIFDVLSDIDAKFAKFVDKECDVISGEVRKWFKKLAKEEKAHDDKIANANAKIKQAGLAYEKKAKKNTYDPEEHNRYINLLNTLGPEISQDKYNHALSVSQKNAAVTFQVAATLSRIAEAEWLRSAEGVRRFSPLVGQLGEWKALCEGGWDGPVPGDLPDVDQVAEPSWSMQDPPPLDRELGLAPNSPRPLPVPSSLRTIPVQPPPTVYEDGSVRSIASLGSFPEPPSHFPIPPLTGSVSSSSGANSPVTPYNASVMQGSVSMQSRASSDVSGSGSGSGPSTSLPRVAEIPKEDGRTTPALTSGSLSPEPRQEQLITPTMTPLVARLAEVRMDPLETMAGLGEITDEPTEINAKPSLPSSPASTEPLRPPVPASIPPPLPLVPDTMAQTPQRPEFTTSVTNRSNSYAANNSSFKRGDYLDDREFGLDPSTEAAQSKARSLDSAQGRVDRSDTLKSNGSVVAQIRDKYARSTGPASPPPRDIPRLPLSVASIATKYQAESSNEPMTSPAQRARSPTNDSSRRSQDSGPSPSRPQQGHQFPSLSPKPTGLAADELALRRQRIEELEELERREHAFQLRTRERELEARERERMETLRSRAGDGYARDASRSPQPLFTHRPLSQASLQSQPRSPAPTSRYSYSTTNLLPPGASAPSAPTPQRPVQSQDLHLPDCQCPACTVARYAEKPLTARIQEQKPKGGWMRRLSMPSVSNAFSSDSKKAGVAGGKGASSTALGALGDANRSVTSFGRR
ncbi:hypothetical protein BC834DRAFT_973912 [Gloeopeniophorella convolvens]|nr:hypothetical protein BC834DRAFT_973912 [Gloeopeniophorella convolvens]